MKLAGVSENQLHH